MVYLSEEDKQLILKALRVLNWTDCKELIKIIESSKSILVR